MGCDGWVNVTEVFYFCVWKTSHETEQLPCTYMCVCVWPFINELLTGHTQLWTAHVSPSLVKPSL
jgi:hypothetical protein